MSWKSVLGSVAPTLATALGGPLAGMATKAITSSLFPEEEGITPKQLEHKLEVVVGNDPSVLVRLKELDKEFQVEMETLGLDLEKVHAADRASARDMAKTTGLLPQMIISAVYVVGFVVIMYSVFTGEVQLQGDQERIANLLIGILSAGLMQIMNFFFGSSSGSKEKTARLTNGGK